MTTAILAIAVMAQCPGGVCSPTMGIPYAPTVSPFSIQPLPPVMVRPAPVVIAPAQRAYLDGLEQAHPAQPLAASGQRYAEPIPANVRWFWKELGKEPGVEARGYLDAAGNFRYDPSSRRRVPAHPKAAVPAEPIAPTPQPTPQPTSYATNGVDLTRLAESLPPGGERYEASGPAGRAFAAEAKALGRGAIGADQTDDSRKPFLSVIGTEADRAAVMRDLAPGGPLAWAREQYQVKDYDPSDWAITGVGLPSDGKPSIGVPAAPDAAGRGKVLWRQSSYEGGAAALAEALRKTNPDYKPDRDPGPAQPKKPRRPTPGPPLDPDNPEPPDAAVTLPSWFWPAAALAGIAFVMLATRPKVEATHYDGR